MPVTTVRDSAYFRNLEYVLDTARKSYNGRKTARAYNFIMGSASSEDGLPAQDLIHVPDHILTTADLQRKIQYIETRLADLIAIEHENIIIEHNLKITATKEATQKVAHEAAQKAAEKAVAKAAAERAFHNNFNQRIQILPLDMQPLKVLYTIGKYDIVKNILNKYDDVYNNKTKLNLLIDELNVRCDEQCRNEAKIFFKNKFSDYSNFPEQHRNAMEEQYAYVIILRSYAYFAGQDSKSQESLDKLAECSDLLIKNISNVIANKATLDNAKKDYDEIKQQLNKIEEEHREKCKVHKTIDNVCAVANNNKIIGGVLAATGYYFGIGPLLNVAAFGSVAVPVGATLAANYEVNHSKFPKLDQQRAFLDCNDLDLVDRVFFSRMDQEMKYDPITGNYIDPHAELSLEIKSYFQETRDNFIKKITEEFNGYINLGINKTKEFADKKNVFNEFNSAKTVAKEVLIAAGKTLAGLVFITGITLIISLLAVGLTGPILLFAITPTLSIGLLGAAIVAGLKFMYPNPQETTMGFLVDATVKVIFSPISVLASGVEILSRPFTAFYNVLNTTKVQPSELRSELPIKNFSEDEYSVAFKDLRESDPELLPILIRYFNAEQQIIKDKMIAASSDDAANVALQQAITDMAKLHTYWELLKCNGNKLDQFYKLLKSFSMERYIPVRNDREAKAKERAKVGPYVETRRPVLRFDNCPDFAMPNLVEYSKEQQDLNDLRSLRRHSSRLSIS